MADILQEHKFLLWKKELEEHGCSIKSIKSLEEIRKKNGELLFALLDADVWSKENTKLPHIIFIRGHAVVAIILLINKDTQEEKFLMVRQRRIGNGQMSLEFPAGMLDLESDPEKVILKEIEEETGLVLSKDEIHYLNKEILYSSAGASDEGLYFFGAIKFVNDHDYKAFQNRLTGNIHEAEHIEVVLKSREEGEAETTSAQARLGFYLFDNWKNKREIY